MVGRCLPVRDSMLSLQSPAEMSTTFDAIYSEIGRPIPPELASRRDRSSRAP
jgi:hypothetical protein